MTTKYPEEAALALELISEFGGPVKILAPVMTTGEGDNPRWYGSGEEPVEYDAQAVVFPYEGAQAVAKPDAQQALIAGRGLAIEITNEMLFKDKNGQIWSIKNTPQKLAPDMGDAILWDCEVVKWAQRL